MGDAIEKYLKQHAISEMLNGLVNELVEAQPKDPINFLISGLLKEAAARGQEPDLLLRLHELKQQLVKDQKEASGAVAEKARLEAELVKAQYNVKHLRKTIDELEAGGASAGGSASAGAPVGMSTAGVTGVPPGHTPFSWAGGVTLAAGSGAGGGSAAPAAATAASSGDQPLSLESFSKRVRICKVLGGGKAAVGTKDVKVCGWARTIRMQAELCFIALNDGSCMGNLQLVIEKKLLKEGWDELKAKGSTGCSIAATGTLVESPAAGQVTMHPRLRAPTPTRPRPHARAHARARARARARRQSLPACATCARRAPPRHAPPGMPLPSHAHVRASHRPMTRAAR